MFGARLLLHTALYTGGRVLSAASSVMLHAAAGLIRLDDLRHASQRAWDEREAGYSPTYIHSGLFKWEQEFYLPVLKREDRVLVVGCGTGRDLLALLELGYRADGLDSGERLTTVARQTVTGQVWPVTILTGAIETVALSASYDVVIFSWFCYSYIPQTRCRVEILRKVKRHLEPGGRVLISYIPRGRRHHALMALTRFVARLSGSDWHPEPGDYVSHDRPGRYISHYEHQFLLAEIEAEAREAGLAVVRHAQTEHGELVLKV